MTAPDTNASNEPTQGSTEISTTATDFRGRTDYTIDPREDGETIYHYATGESFAFGGADAIDDQPGGGVLINLRDAQGHDKILGPIIRDDHDDAYTKLKAAVLKRPGGAEDWAKLGIDTMLATGSSENAANTPSIANAPTQPVADGIHDDTAAIQAAVGAPKTDEPTSEAVPAANPVAPGVTVPDGHVAVDVPAEIQAQLPTGTVVSMNPSAQLVASVPKDGTVHHILVEAGLAFEHVVAAVEAFFRRVL